jgi:hypothetical protein
MGGQSALGRLGQAGLSHPGQAFCRKSQSGPVRPGRGDLQHVTTEIERAALERAREQEATLAQIANELATLNKTLRLIAESLRAIASRLP